MEHTLKKNLRLHGKVYYAGEKIKLNEAQAKAFKKYIKTKKIKDGDTDNSND